MLFCPTETAIENLEREGVTKSVHLTGDVMVDALRENIEIAEQKSKILDLLGLKQEKYYLATIHRPENTDAFKRLKSIMDAFCLIEKLVFPCHPRTENLRIIETIWALG